ncbi:NAD(P)H-dependent oxidoreductase [Actinoplanes sp. NPDC051851]|uniref:FMN-dependent NADH-azoreductase n=1 Tax=Actinoplanes sp. NPDC051851 TaxID=3154753 RepID=UPI003449ABB6
MPHLLHIDTSTRVAGSVSRELSAAFAKAWQAKHPDGEITYRDLAANPVPYPDLPSLGDAFAPASSRTPEQAASWEITEQLIAELEAADTYVFALPMYNFAVPASFKAWVDRIVLPGRTFDTETRQGKLVGKDVTVITARGGSYAPGTPRAPFDFQEPWITAALGQVGLDDIRYIHAELTLAATMPKMAAFKDMAVESRRRAYEIIEDLHAPADTAG